MSVVCCEVEICASGRSFVQGGPRSVVCHDALSHDVLSTLGQGTVRSDLNVSAVLALRAST